MQKNTLWVVMKPLVTSLAILILLSTVFLSSSLAGGVEPLPGLQKAVQDIQSHHKGEDLSFLAEKEYQVRKYYYEIQSKMQKLEILEEVKEHFDRFEGFLPKELEHQRVQLEERLLKEI